MTTKPINYKRNCWIPYNGESRHCQCTVCSFFSSPCQRPPLLQRCGLFKIYKKCSENPVRNCKWNTLFCVLSSDKLAIGMLQTELNSCPMSSKPSLIPVSGFRSRFSIIGTTCKCKNGNAISGRNLPVLNCSYHLPKPTGLPKKMVNNQDLALWEERKVISAIYDTEKELISNFSAHKPVMQKGFCW